MPSSLIDVCRFNPTAGGTTDWTYSSAVTGYQSPTAAGAVNGATYSYRAESADLTQWEVGTGAYNSGAGVFARTAVLFNSSGTTSKISFSAAPQVAIVALAEDLLPITSVGPFTNSLGSDVLLNNTANYFDGPSVAQGSVGTFFASGTVTIFDSATATISAKLWDGTTVIASTQTVILNTETVQPISLSGTLAGPAGNLRISVRDLTNTSGKILSNQSGNSKDSTITVFRIK
jgi:hypothetical protein